MNSELNKTVIRHLQSQRDSAATLRLWEDLWIAYERGGSEGVTELIDQLIVLPPDSNDRGRP